MFLRKETATGITRLKGSTPEKGTPKQTHLDCASPGKVSLQHHKPTSERASPEKSSPKKGSAEVRSLEQALLEECNS